MNYHNITYPDMLNGDGLRVVLWLSGCSHHCKGCQNPQTWDANSGILFDENAKEELFRELSKDYVSGITFSGGDPLNEHNVEEVYNLCIGIRQEFGNSKNIWLYTGYTWEEIFTKWITDKHQGKMRKILSLCDVLVDGRYVEEQRDVSLHWRGSSNQRVIDLNKSFKLNKIILHEE